MVEWLYIIFLVVYIISTYYFFFAYAFKKAVLLAMTSTTLFACTLLSFSTTGSGLREPASNNLYLNSRTTEIQKPFIYNTQNPNIIQITDAILSNLKIHQYSEGNSLYVINGDIKNNSSSPITTVRLEIRLSDCGLKNKKSKCVPIEDSFYVENTILHIKPQETSQFDTSFSVDHPEHRYEIDAYFMGAELNHKNLAAITSQKDNKNIDRMIICGGGADRDKPEIERRYNGKVMLAEALEDYQRRDRGC
jgi:hypothetical protein